MNSLFFLIDQLAIGIYILLIALIIVFIRQALIARAEYRATTFELERDLARYRQANALTYGIVTAQIIALVLGIQQVVVPYLENEQRLQEQVIASREDVQDGVFATPTPAPQFGQTLDIEPAAPFADSDTILLLTPTLTPTPVGTIVPNPPVAQGCDDERARLLIPANGMRVFQPITVVGTAFTDEFARAKLEIQGPSTQNNYAVINDILQPVTQPREFSQFAPANYEDGVYQFRLTVFNVDNILVASCMVNIYISDPPVLPTATPIPD